MYVPEACTCIVLWIAFLTDYLTTIVVLAEATGDPTAMAGVAPAAAPAAGATAKRPSVEKTRKPPR